MQRLLAFGFCMLVSSYCFAETFGDFSYTTNEIGAKITGYSGTDTTINIPSEINGTAVKIIGAQSFWYNTNISKVILPNSIVKIEAQAFQGCAALNEINLPEGLTHIGTQETGGAVFYECTSLTNITLPESLTYLDGSMFQGTKIKKIRIPPAVNYLGPWVFVYANELEEVKFSGALPNEIAGSTFAGNSSNLVVKYISGLGGWTNASGIWPDVAVQPYAAALVIRQSKRGTINAIPAPTVDNNQYYEIGTQVSLSVAGSNSFTFSNWSGDVDGTNNPLTIALNSGRTIQAKFDPRDLDGDGVNDFRENQDGTDPNNPAEFNSLSKGLVAYYMFENDANDSSGYDNDGISHGATSTSDPYGIPLKAIYLNGNSYVEIPYSSKVFDFKNREFSFSFWIKHPQNPLGVLRRIAGNNSLEGRRFWFETINGNLDIYAFDAAGNQINVPTGINIGNDLWQNIIIQKDNSQGKIELFQNGIKVFQQNLSEEIRSTLDGFQIGKNLGLNNYFSGSIDEFRIYNRALTQSEIDSLVTANLSLVDSNEDGVKDIDAISSGLNPLWNLQGFLHNLKNNPNYGLYNSNQIQTSRIEGRADVTNNPSVYGLFTSNQIHNLRLGGIILNRDTNNQLILNYQILESTDLVNWTPKPFQMLITNAPTNKMFLRVQAVEH